MDRQYIQDHQVIERYLRGNLTAEEEQAFEEAYLAEPALLEELELTERLEQGIKDVGARGELKRARGATKWLSALASPQYAAAASVLLAVTLALSGALYVDNLKLRQGQSLTAATAMRVISLDTLRGTTALEIEAPGENETAGLLVDAGYERYDSYRVVIARRGEQGTAELARADGLTADYQDQLAVGVPGRLLTPGLYEVAVEGRMNDWPAEQASALVTRILVRFVASESP